LLARNRTERILIPSKRKRNSKKPSKGYLVRIPELSSCQMYLLSSADLTPKKPDFLISDISYDLPEKWYFLNICPDRSFCEG
jgi:hypothetical protein